MCVCGNGGGGGGGGGEGIPCNLEILKRWRGWGGGVEEDRKSKANRRDAKG